MAYRDFANDRQKGILKDVLMFYGAEDYLINWAVDKIISDNVEEEKPMVERDDYEPPTYDENTGQMSLF